MSKSTPPFLRNSLSSLLVILVFLCGIYLPNAKAADSEDLAMALLEESGLWRGVCSVIGPPPSEEIGLMLAETGDIHAHVLLPKGADLEHSLDRVDKNERFGRTLVVETQMLDSLPYATNSIDLVLGLSNEKLEISANEILRSLRPGGVAILQSNSLQASEQKILEGLIGDPVEVVEIEGHQWLRFKKPEMENTDDWTHWEHGPDNNPVSTDTNTEPPFMTQFLGSPYYTAMPAITTAAGGRTFLAMGHIAHHEREEEWLNTLVARNGYNGMELWRRKLPDGYMVHRSAFIATDDVFYMIDPNGNGVLKIDPETGDQIGRVRIRGMRGDWKWMGMVDGVLYGLVGKEEDPAETTVVRSEISHWSWEELSRGYYEEQVPWGFGETLIAYDLEEDEVRWKQETDEQIDSRALAIGDGKLYYYGPNLHIGCVDTNSGLRVWSTNNQEMIQLIEEQGKALTSTPGFRSSCYMLYTPEALIFQAQTRMNVVGVSTEDGRLLWKHGKTTNNPNLLFADDHLYVGIGDEGSTMMVNPETGEVVKDLEFGKRSCARLTATPYQMFCRAKPEGTTFYDRSADKVRQNGAFRPACNDGVIGANGHLYVGPWLCDCNLSLMGSIALTSAGDFTFDLDSTPRLEKGKAYDSDPAEPVSDSLDWGTYRGNNGRTGTTEVAIEGGIDLVWETEPEFPFTPTAPVASGGHIFYAGDDGKIRSVNAFTGELEWVYRTAGPIKAAPTVSDGRLYAGSGDGYVYCLEAETGRLTWRFRAAPKERRMMVYGRLASTWPVNTGVLVHEGTAYFAAGIIDYDGTYVYALDAKTGSLKWKNDKTGHLDPDLRKGVSAQGYLTVLDDTLYLASGNAVSPAAFNLKTGAYEGLEVGDGTPVTNRGEEVGVFGDRFIIHGGRLQYSAAKNVVNPGFFAGVDTKGKEGLSKARMLNSGKIPPVWDEAGFYYTNGPNMPPTCWSSEDLTTFLETGKKRDSPVPKWTCTRLNDHDTVAMALAKGVLVTVNESPTPRSLVSTWSISGVDPGSGNLLWKTWLGRPALPGGLLVDREGRVVVVHEGGGLTCMGADRVLSAYLDYLLEESGKGPGGRERITRLLNDALAKIHTENARERIVELMEDNGIVVGKRARENGAIIDWHLMGPLPWDDAHGFEKVFMETDPVDLEEIVSVDDLEKSWRKYLTIKNDGMVDLADIYGRLEEMAVFGYAEIDLEEDQLISLSVGSNDSFMLWFNGEEAGRFEGGRPYSPGQDVLEVHGKKGKNTILIKVHNWGSNWAFGVRLVDDESNPISLVSAN